MNKALIKRTVFFSNEDNISNMVHITLLPKDLALYWQRCGLTADFGASFASFCFPKISEAKNSLSVILNELVENAVKYSSESSKRIKITLCDNDGFLYFEVENYISDEQKKLFIDFIEKLESAEDINDFYTEAMEKAMTGEGSGLGLLTILNDYNVGMSFTFSKKQDFPSFHIVKLQVRINPEGIIC
ncbi:MAG: DUF6272 family protein [Spirochaetaceae bacterium]